MHWLLKTTLNRKCTHTHTHTHIQAPTYTSTHIYTHTQTLSHTHTHAHICKLIHTNSLTHTHTHTHWKRHMYTHWHTDTYTHPHSYTQRHVHTHKHPQTPTLTFQRSGGLGQAVRAVWWGRSEHALLVWSQTRTHGSADIQPTTLLESATTETQHVQHNTTMHNL